MQLCPLFSFVKLCCKTNQLSKSTVIPFYCSSEAVWTVELCLEMGDKNKVPVKLSCSSMYFQTEKRNKIQFISNLHCPCVQKFVIINNILQSIDFLKKKIILTTQNTGKLNNHDLSMTNLTYLAKHKTHIYKSKVMFICRQLIWPYLLLQMGIVVTLKYKDKILKQVYMCYG